MDTSQDSLGKLIDFLSLFIVFSFVIFDLRYSQIASDLDRELPNKGLKKEIEIAERRFNQAIWIKTFPLALVFGLLIYLLLPSVVSIMKASTFSIWDFDPIRTFFIFIFGFVVAFFIWSLWLLFKLFSRKKMLKT